MGIVGSALCAGLMHLNLNPVHFAEPYRSGGGKASSAFGMLFIVPGIRFS